MGLDTTHDAWHGPYSSFHRWRTALCAAAGWGKLDERVGFGGETPWDLTDPLTKLLHHSDCEGSIAAEDCAAIADRLKELLPALSDEESSLWFSDAEKARRFIKGLRKAARAGEDVEFH